MKDLIVQIAIAVIPILGAWVAKVLLANKQALTLVQVLEPLAQASRYRSRTVRCYTGNNRGR